MFYARTENGEGKRETVQHHLLRTAQLAKGFASDFDSEEEAEIAALLHDFGKYSKLFQAVLNGTEQHVNHDAAGALISINCYGKVAMTIARTIFGHHKGLEYDIDAYLKESGTIEGSADKYNRRYALSGKKEYLESYKVFCSEIALPKNNIVGHDNTYCFNHNIADMLYVRMIFSCLVDADYTSSAEHFDKDYLIKSSGGLINTNEILQRLFKYRDKIRITSNSNDKINKIRDDLFDYCVKSAEKPVGLFTLTAPTGTGKTISLLAFALKHAEKYNKKRIILVLPFLSIIEQNAKIYKDICGEILEDHSQNQYDEQSKYYSDRWDYPVIVTTSVKFFEVLFKHKPTDCRRLHNITNSVIVFDEAQSLPSHLIGVTLDSINALCKKYNSSIVFSTATQPSFSYRSDIEWKPIEIVHHPQTLYNHTRRVNVQWRVQNPIPFSQIAYEMSKLDNCCAIVNMKRHSIKLFEELLSLCDENSIFHISTEMCTAHRIDTLNKIKEQLQRGIPCRIVSTQCIEAGVDLDVKTVYRALAPLDSIIQSAGRCNRNGNLNKGQVIVFIPNDEKGVLYPDDYYKNAANKVLLLLSRHEIDICDTQHIEEYYELLFSDNSQDEQRLLNAISEMNFEETDYHYRLIKQTGVNIIVPYYNKMELYNEIKQQAISSGLTPQLMIKARPIAVSSYNVEKVKELCESLFYSGSYKNTKSESNWYILHNKSLYSNSTGLTLKKESSLDYTF